MRPSPPSLEYVAERIDCALPLRERVSVVLYGSTVANGALGADVDVWLQADPEAIPVITNALDRLALKENWRVDVAVDSTEPREIDSAARWCVATSGLVIVGDAPVAPAGMTYRAAERIYRCENAREAQELAARAASLRRRGHPATAWFAQEAVRAWLRAIGNILNPLRERGLAVLHDRRIPRSRANIDHIVVAPYGVFVIDAKNYKGRVERRDRGGLFSTDYRLYVGGRDKTQLVVGMQKQAEAVRVALGVPPEEIPIVQTICFVAADWSLWARPIQFDAVQVLWPRALLKQMRLEGPVSRSAIPEIERRLGLALPPA